MAVDGTSENDSLRYRLKLWWQHFRASRLRQLGGALLLVVILAVLLTPEAVHRPLVGMMIPVTSWFAFKLRRDQERDRRG
jgi:hypothetical protein